jgi:site-specific recombinase XerD
MAMADRRDRSDPADLSIPEAVDRWLRRKRGSLADATVREYGYRLERFREFCDEEGIDRVGVLHPLDFDDYLAYREQLGVQPITITKHFTTIAEFVGYLEDLGAVDDGLSDAIPDVSVPEGGAVDDVMLEPADGDALIEHYRNSDADYGGRQHAILEVIWFVGCRLGALRGLDLGDIDVQDSSLAFVHRPDTGTPLKKAFSGERTVAIPQASADAIGAYVHGNRYERRDDNGRVPLFTSTHGRPSPNTLRNWTYLATVPCTRGPCPHDKDPDSCEYLESTTASGCPSSRSPNQVRSGAITRMLHRTDKERVKYRAKTTQWEHYDHATERQKMEHRDREVLADIELEDGGDA